MSINQDALDDLASLTGETVDELKNAGTQDPTVSQEPAKFASVGGTPLEDETPVSDQVRAQLMNPNTTFTNLLEGVEQTSAMGNVLDTIADNGTISLSDLPSITPRFENFDKMFHPRSFTKEPSSVNLPQALGFMRQAVKLRKEEMRDKLHYFFSASVIGAEEAFQLYKEFYGSELIESLQAFQARLADLQSDKQWHDKQLIQFGGKDVDITSLEAFDILAAEGSVGEYYQVPVFEKFREAVKDFQGYSKSQLLVSPLIDSIRKTKSVDELIDAGERADTYGLAISPMELVEAIASPYTIKVIQTMEVAVKEGLQSLYELEKKTNIDPTDFTQVQDFVIKNGAQLDRATAYCHYYAETIDTLRRLFLVASAFMDYYQHAK